MGKSQPTYSKEFKQQVVRLFKTSGKTKTQIARDLGISDSAAAANGAENFESLEKKQIIWKGHQTSLEENSRLRRENKALRQESKY